MSFIPLLALKSDKIRAFNENLSRLINPECLTQDLIGFIKRGEVQGIIFFLAILNTKNKMVRWGLILCIKPIFGLNLPNFSFQGKNTILEYHILIRSIFNTYKEITYQSNMDMIIFNGRSYETFIKAAEKISDWLNLIAAEDLQGSTLLKEAFIEISEKFEK